MITIGNKKFAESEKEFIESLFEGESTCFGYAKRLKNKIKLFDHQKKLKYVINQWGVICTASLDFDKPYYFFTDCKREFGIDSIGEENEIINSIATKKEFSFKDSCSKYFFK